MMKPLSFRITSNHLPLCVFLSLLWGTTFTATEPATTTPISFPPPPTNFTAVGQSETSINLQWDKVSNDSSYLLQYNDTKTNITETDNDTVSYNVSDLTSGTAYTFTLYTVFGGITSTGVNLTAYTVPPPPNNFTAVGQSETSINLRWDKVSNYSGYLLQYNKNETNITEPYGDTVSYNVSDLTSGTAYTFTLYTVFEGITSTGVNLTAYTVPPPPNNFKAVGQSETSINLQWDKVSNYSGYLLQYNKNETNITETDSDPVSYNVSDLTSATAYTFTLYTVFGGITSTGVNLTAYTAPPPPTNFTAVGQSETSINLQWDKVSNDYSYSLQYNDTETNITEPYGDTVSYNVSDLTSGTAYTFTLYTVFGGITSTGVNLTAYTAPLNAKEFKSVIQNDTSITLQWKKVDNKLNYTLEFSERVINVTASEGSEPVTYIISDLRSATIYNITLFTVFERLRSKGVRLVSLTAPEKVKNVTVETQNVSSITLKWDKVDNVSTYRLSYDKRCTHIEESSPSVNYEVSSLAAGTKYNFTLISVFHNVSSDEYTFEAETVPPSLVGVNITERSLTSFTLSWKNVKKDWKYLLDINGNITMNTSDEDVVAYSVSSLKPGTRYNFSVTTTFTQLHSAPFTDYTVTAMDCSSVPWHVTSSSIQGMVKGVFTNATAVYNQNLSVSPQGSNVSFTHLVPGATYEVLLVYKELEQCRQRITIIPTNVHGSCSYLNGGSSIVVFWDEPTGVWTEVEVNVTGRTVKIYEHTKRQTIISALQPAKTYEVSLSLLSGDLRSHEPFIVFCSTDPRGVIAGSVLAVLLFLVLVFLAVFILLKRPDFIRNKTFIRRSKLSQSSKKCKEIPVGMFPDHFSQLSMDENRGFVQEYEDLVPIGTEQTRRAAVLPENKAKNRFNNVLPYDWCRVKLTTSNPNETSDYINASYMPGYNREREYIATQGPLPSTVGDFWRMIWEQRVKGIVMVTNCVELGRTKCERYWPADSKPNLQGQLVITLRSEIQERNWTLREFNLKHKSTSEERMVKHFHFTAWPDHGVPLGTNVLIQFRELVRRHIEKEGDGAPTVVHCSAGVGRTGTLIALDVLLQQLKQKRAVGINAFVHKMRLSRPYMVQTESQYVFLHQCMMDSLEPETEENIYENADMIYVNATALQEFCQQQRHT
ncbi:receptor-type tyrosine-protein phosphatase H isoform X2 [Echeneis naucrates]|uniref:receptor-type tyrosine-protein phosphatase H isoform X2 n=1 Tax=Echeneis naucrates TaxID=173247 RepID=UPI0011145225|nr:receptor-type tyrosine-protein phosphatase H isoform X2 [Echeneis naucrates]